MQLWELCLSSLINQTNMNQMNINVKIIQSFYIWFHSKDITLSEIIGNHSDANLRIFGKRPVFQ